jgi:hypothetical protein
MIADASLSAAEYTAASNRTPIISTKNQNAKYRNTIIKNHIAQTLVSLTVSSGKTQASSSKQPAQIICRK